MKKTGAADSGKKKRKTTAPKASSGKGTSEEPLKPVNVKVKKKPAKPVTQILEDDPAKNTKNTFMGDMGIIPTMLPKAVNSKVQKSLTKAELLRIEIIIWVIEHPSASDEDAMKKFNVSRSTVARAKRWGKQKGLYEWQAAGLIKIALKKLDDLRESVMDQFNHVVRYNDNQALGCNPTNAKGIAALGSLILRIIMSESELLGIIYNKKVTIDVSGENVLQKMIEKFDSIGEED